MTKPIRLARAGDEFVSSYWDGTAWVEVARLTADLDVRQVGLFGLSAQDGTAIRADFDYLTLKVVNAQDTGVRTTVRLDGRAVWPTATVTTLTGEPGDFNSLTQPARVSPVERRVGGFSNAFTYDFPAYSVTFIRLNVI